MPDCTTAYNHVTKLGQWAKIQARKEVAEKAAEGKRRANLEHAKQVRRMESLAVLEEYATQPVYQAIATIKEKNIPGLEGKAILYSEAEKSISKESIDLINKKHGRIILKKKGGVSPDDAATNLGVQQSGKEFLEAMLHAPKLDELVHAETQRRIEAKYGEALVEDPPITIVELALSSMNTARIEQILAEVRRMAGDFKIPAREVERINVEQLSKLAREEFYEQMQSRVKPAVYRNRMVSEAMKAEKLAEAGDIVNARIALEKQVLSMVQFKAALQLRSDLNARKKEFAGWAKRRGSAEQMRRKRGLVFDLDGNPFLHFQQGVDMALEAVGLKNVSETERTLRQERGITFDSVLQKMADEAVALDGVDVLEPFNVDTVRPIMDGHRKWSQLTIVEAQEVSKYLKALDAEARLMNSMFKEGEAVEIEEVVARFREQMAEFRPYRKDKYVPPEERGRLFNRLKDLAMSADAVQMDIRAMAKIVDMGDTGPFHDFIANEYMDARLRKFGIREPAAKKIEEAWKALPKEIQKSLYDRNIQIPDFLLKSKKFLSRYGPEQKSRMWWYGVYQHMGNESNRHRLLTSFGVDAEAFPGLMAFFQKILPVELTDIAQTEWNVMGSLWPHVTHLIESMYGYAPPKISPAPVEIHGKTYEGGYMPLKIDRRSLHDLRGKGRNWGSLKDLIGTRNITKGELESGNLASVLGKGHKNMATMAHTDFTIARLENADYTILFDRNIVDHHIEEVSHAVAFNPILRRAARLFRRPEFRALITEKMGDQYYSELLSWVHNTATENPDPYPQNMSELIRWMRSARGMLIVAGLGWNVRTFMLQYGDPLLAPIAGRVGKEYFAKATQEIFTKPGGYREVQKLILSLSKEYPQRKKMASQKYGIEAQRITGPEQFKHAWSPWVNEIRDSAFFLLRTADEHTTTPVWYAKFLEVMDTHKGMIASGAITREAATQEAVKAADNLILDFWPSIEDGLKSGILRNKGALGMLLVFHGYFNKQYQVSRIDAERAWQSWNEEDPFLAAMFRQPGMRLNMARMAGSVLGRAIVYGMFGPYLAGRGPREDEEGWRWGARQMASGLVSPVPFADDFLGWVLQDGRMYGSGVPAMDSIQNLVNKATSAGSNMLEGEYFESFKDAAEATAIVMKLPSAAPRRQLEAAQEALMDPAERPPRKNIEDTMADVIYGRRFGDTRTPLHAPRQIKEQMKPKGKTEMPK